MADGLTDKTGKKLLPAGAVLWAWEADAEFDEEPVANPAQGQV